MGLQPAAEPPHNQAHCSMKLCCFTAHCHLLSCLVSVDSAHLLELAPWGLLLAKAACLTACLVCVYCCICLKPVVRPPQSGPRAALCTHQDQPQQRRGKPGESNVTFAAGLVTPAAAVPALATQGLAAAGTGSACAH